MYEQTAIELAMAEGQSVDEAKAKEAIRHFEDFYEGVKAKFIRKDFKPAWKYTNGYYFDKNMYYSYKNVSISYNVFYLYNVLF